MVLVKDVLLLVVFTAQRQEPEQLTLQNVIYQQERLLVIQQENSHFQQTVIIRNKKTGITPFFYFFNFFNDCLAFSIKKNKAGVKVNVQTKLANIPPIITAAIADFIPSALHN